LYLMMVLIEARNSSDRWRRQSIVIVVLLVWLLPMAIGAAVNYPLRWRWSNPTPHGNNIKDMAYNSSQNLAVQVTERGQIYTSSDLDLWLVRASGATNALRAVTFFGNRIIIVGENGTALYADSLDSFRPASIAATTDWLEGVAASSSGLVAVGDNGAVYTSPNGQSWTKRNVSFTTWLRGVAFGGSRFVAVGENGFIASSNDGSTWLQQNSGVSQHLNKVYWNGVSFVVVGAAGVVLTNNLNTWWQARGVGAGGELYSGSGSAAGGARIVHGDNELRLYDNGLWSAQLAPTNIYGAPAWTYYSSLAFPGLSTSFLVGGNTGLMAEGYRTNGTYYWIQSARPVRTWLWDVCRVTNLYVTVGDHATIMTSLDGVDWQLELAPEAITNNVLLGIGGDANLLVAVGDAGSIITSTNSVSAIITTNGFGTNRTYTTNLVSNLGLLWTAVAPRPTTNTLQGVTARNGQYVIVGDAGTILTSTNGFAWIGRSAPTNFMLTSAAAFPQGFVACGQQGTLLYSADALTWTLQPSGTTNWLYRVRYLNGGLVALGQNGVLLTSTDGQNWTSRASGATAWLNDLAYISDTYFAIGTLGTVLASTNTVTWNALGTITSKSLYGAATDGSQLIAVGIEGVILRSQVMPLTNAVNILSYSLTVTSNALQNIFLFRGQPDQRFSLESNNDLNPTNWYTDATLEMVDSSGTLYYLLASARHSAPPRRFYRTRLIP
jgi:hypothetical protein